MALQKKDLVAAILTTLKKELEVLLESAKAAHEAATHEESKAEDQHDTRGLEASYLAGAQMARAESLRRTISSFQSSAFRSFSKAEPIGLGALVRLRQTELSPRGPSGPILCYFLAPSGGGIVIHHDGLRVQVVTPQSPVGEELLGKRAGDVIEIMSQRTHREYEILSLE